MFVTGRLPVMPCAIPMLICKSNGPRSDQRGKSIRQRYNVFKEIPSRPDLPAGYGGWQAIDSTPQVIKSMENCIKWQFMAQDGDQPTFGCYQ